MYKVVLILLLMCSILIASTFKYNGLIQSRTGVPIEGARVISLQSGKETTTDSLGRFGDYTVPISEYFYKKSLINPVLDLNLLYYASAAQGEKVAVTIFDLKGRTVFSKKCVSKNVGLNTITFNSNNRFGTGLYIVNLVVGDKVYNFKSIVSDIPIRNTPRFSLVKEKNTSYRSEHRIELGDTLFVNASGYKDTLIISPSIDVGTITLSNVSKDTADIEFGEIKLAYSHSNFPKIRRDTVLLDIYLKNTGQVNALSVKCSLSTNDTNIQIIDNLSNYNNIVKGESQNCTTPYKVCIPRTFPAGQCILFSLNVEDSWGGKWIDKICYIPYPFTVSMQKIDDDKIPDSNGNGDNKVDLYEIIEYTPQIQNLLDIKVDSVVGELMSDIDINVKSTDALWKFGNIDTLEKKLPELDYVFTAINNLKVIDSMFQADMIISCKINNSMNSFLMPINITAGNIVMNQDTIPPVIAISGDNPDTINVGDSWMMPTVVAFDNVDGDVTSSITVSGAVNNTTAGKNEINITAVDAAGNISKDTLIVIVKNIKKEPQLVLKGADSLILTLGDNYVDPGYFVIDSSGDTLSSSLTAAIVTEEIYNSSNVQLSSSYIIGSESGKFRKKYTLIYEGKNIIRWRYLFVTYGDTIPPIVTLNGSNIIQHPINTAYHDSGATAIDNIDGDISNSVICIGENLIDTKKLGTYKIGYFAVDNAGNVSDTVSRYVFVIEVLDSISPVISMLGSNPDTILAGVEYVDNGAIAFDNVDGDITHNILVNNNVNSSQIGFYKVIYTVSDAAGNADTAIRNIVVIADNEAPVISFIGGSFDTVNLFLSESDYNQTPVATDNKDGDITSSIMDSGTINYNIPGVYKRFFWVSDSDGNIGYKEQVFIISNPIIIDDFENGDPDQIGLKGLLEQDGRWYSYTSDETSFGKPKIEPGSSLSMVEKIGATGACNGDKGLYAKVTLKGEHYPFATMGFNFRNDSTYIDLSSMTSLEFSIKGSRSQNAIVLVSFKTKAVEDTLAKNPSWWGSMEYDLTNNINSSWTTIKILPENIYPSKFSNIELDAKLTWTKVKDMVSGIEIVITGDNVIENSEVVELSIDNIKINY